MKLKGSFVAEEYQTLTGETALSTAEFINDPARLRRELILRGALTFTPYPSGLFPASDLPPELGEATSMDMAWFRDNAHVSNALYVDGRHDLAVPAGQAMLIALEQNRHILDDVVLRGNITRRLPVRVDGSTLANDSEPRIQNDSVGYLLWYTSRLLRDGALRPTERTLETIAQTVRYLEAVGYWQDFDEGHWEEDERIHGSSIGAVIAGLQGVQSLFNKVGYVSDIDFTRRIVRGYEALLDIRREGLTDITLVAKEGKIIYEQPYSEFIKPNETVHRFFEDFSIHRRTHDAAMLFLVEPLGVIDGELAEQIVLEIEANLERDIGFARYAGDTYWMPRFPSIMSIEERTFKAEGRFEKRSQKAAAVAYTETEAQWTLFDPLLSAYWGNRYMVSRDPVHRAKQLKFLDRSLGQLVTMPDGTLRWPENFYLESIAGKNRWVPNDHMPLLWTQANVLLALRMFERTSSAAIAD